MTSAALILVRHAAPQIREDQPSVQWPLSDAGRLAAQALAVQIAPYAPAAAVSSPEPKARETLEIVAWGLPVAIDEDLSEHRRSRIGFLPRAEIEAGVAAFFAQPQACVFGDESGEVVLARFAAALARQAAQPLLVGTHGTILSLYLSRVLDLEPMALWKGLALPQAFVLDANGGLIARL
jgi:broad specificity phosphatase PhoE